MYDSEIADFRLTPTIFFVSLNLFLARYTNIKDTGYCYKCYRNDVCLSVTLAQPAKDGMDERGQNFPGQKRYCKLPVGDPELWRAKDSKGVETDSK